jgi:hypothetical protein
MLIREFTETKDGDANLLTVLQFIRNRSHNKKITPVISTSSLINMVKNQGGSEWFNFDNLVAAQERNPAVAELIKNVDREQVTINGFGDEMDAEEMNQEEPAASGASKTPDPEKTVKAMAKRAAANRD